MKAEQTTSEPLAQVPLFAGVLGSRSFAMPHHDLIERYDSEVIYVHSEDCVGICDYSCNGNEGSRMASAISEAESALGSATMANDQVQPASTKLC
jgi:hypothetical protein